MDRKEHKRRQALAYGPAREVVARPKGYVNLRLKREAYHQLEIGGPAFNEMLKQGCNPWE